MVDDKLLFKSLCCFVCLGRKIVRLCPFSKQRFRKRHFYGGRYMRDKEQTKLPLILSTPFDVCSGVVLKKIIYDAC